eukprot:1363025-Alexandrium_andersonii.AAC.1
MHAPTHACMRAHARVSPGRSRALAHACMPARSLALPLAHRERRHRPQCFRLHAHTLIGWRSRSMGPGHFDRKGLGASGS